MINQEHREGAEAINEIVAIPADGSAPPRSIVSGADFYSFPRISPDGKRLASAGGVTEKDVSLARQIDRLAAA